MDRKAELGIGTEHSRKITHSRGGLRLAMAMTGSLLAACVGPQSAEAPFEPYNEGFIRPKPVVVTPTSYSGQIFEIWVKLPPRQSEGDYIKAYTLVVDKEVQTTGIHSGYNYRWSLEVDDKTGSGRPMFEGLMPNWHDWLNYHLAYRQTGGTNSEGLLPDTTHHLVAQSGHAGNACVLELFIDGKLVDKNERWDNGNPNNCTIPVSRYGLAIGRPPETLGGISGHNFPGRVLGFRNNQ